MYLPQMALNASKRSQDAFMIAKETAPPAKPHSFSQAADAPYLDALNIVILDVFNVVFPSN
jgi:hypothetical protein